MRYHTTIFGLALAGALAAPAGAVDRDVPGT